MEGKEKAKGNCFSAAWRHITPRSNEFLVHGLLAGRDHKYEDKLLCHAWIEKEGKVIDRSNRQKINITRDFYYGVQNVRKVKRYTFDEAAKLLGTSGHFGPWENIEEVGEEV